MTTYADDLQNALALATSRSTGNDCQYLEPANFVERRLGHGADEQAPSAIGMLQWLLDGLTR